MKPVKKESPSSFDFTKIYGVDSKKNVVNQDSCPKSIASCWKVNSSNTSLDALSNLKDETPKDEITTLSNIVSQKTLSQDTIQNSPSKKLSKDKLTKKSTSNDTLELDNNSSYFCQLSTKFKKPSSLLSFYNFIWYLLLLFFIMVGMATTMKYLLLSSDFYFGIGIRTYRWAFVELRVYRLFNYQSTCIRVYNYQFCG